MKTFLFIVSFVAVTLTGCIVPTPPQGAPDLAPRAKPSELLRMPKQTARA